ncbi:ABC transporter permease [Micromonospora polyrhachis]|uniref:ABC-2 type transport system permease protein n=1 Tax=Micromonospora polyrhachis TaxID=1282883 RepID=A0A7W7SWR9_9ACTN|nr:ABC-2 family transporter protein [Micromonospora polyrhachis]MBB4961080.1 ABC-2 type transport system permease protein [Micromonospora polyrhachis]
MADLVTPRTRPYRALLRAQTRSQASYRTSFVIDLVSNVGVVALDVLAVLVLFRVTGTLGGFDLRETTVMVGLSAFAFATADLTVGNIERIRQYVRTGLLDAVLVRPLGALPQLLLMDVPLRKVSRSLFGLAVLVAALAYAGIEWTPGRVALVVVAPLAGVVFFGSIFVAAATVAFWWIESGEVGSAFTYGGREFTAYPITVYSGWFRTIFAYGLGFAFVSYYPALALLGRADPLGLPDWVGWVSPAAAVVAATVAAIAWRIGIRHYRSTGS